MAASLLVSRGHAQSPEPPPVSPAVESPSVPVATEGGKPASSPGAVGPDVFFLPDETGALRRVLGYRYEDFLKSWRAGQAQEALPQRPALVVAEFNGDAHAEGDAVSFEAELRVDLQSDEWVEAPLKLGTLILEKWSITGGDDRDFLLFDPERRQYVAWLKGKPGERRTVALTGKFSAQRDGESRRLELELPPAVESHLDFTAASQVEVETPKIAVHSTVTADDGRYTSQIEGAKGRLALQWGPRGVAEFDRAATLSSNIEGTVGVEPGRLSYEVQATVRSFGEPLERVRIRLPRGATPAALPEGAGYDVFPISSTNGRTGSAVVEVRFHEPSTTPPPIRLIAEQSGSGDAGALLQASAFDVIGAFRQRSQLAVRVSETLHADFQAEGRVEQTDVLELPERLRTPPPLAAFVGAGTDWRLDVNVQSRQRKVRVTPTYAMHLGAQGALLDVTLDYQFLGGRTFELRADLRGWELTEQPIESGGVVDSVEQHVTSAGVLIMPLKESNLPQARVRFSLRREAGLGVHELPLAELIDAFSLPGSLTVSCDDAWRATVQVEASSGIATADASAVSSAAAKSDTAVRGATEAVPEPVAAPRRGVVARRFQTFLPRVRVVVDVSEQDQAITVRSRINGRVANDRLEAEQRLEYDVAYQPAGEISATVSTELLANEGLQLLLDGKPLASSAIDVLPQAPTSAGADESNLRLLVRLPRPTLGRSVLQIRTTYRLDESQRAGHERIAVPLAIPAQSGPASAEITVPAGGAELSLWAEGQNDAWRASAPEATGVGGEGEPVVLTASAFRPVGELSLRLQTLSGEEPRDVHVESTWMQTWVVAGQRQDRCAFRFRTSAPEVELQLPVDFEDEPLEIKLDGLPISATSRGRNLTIALPGVEVSQAHTLELRRHAPARLLLTSGLGVEFPRLGHANASSPVFWQVVVPREMAAVTTPDGMNAEYRLGWREWSWGRQPTQTQEDLEQWTGASAAPKLPASTNEYLYSAFDSPLRADVQLVRRAWLIVAAAASALAIGLIALYTNLGRTAGFWLAVIIVAVASLVSYPEAAVVLVQAIFLGGAFTIISLATRWLLADVRVRRRPAPSPASSVASLTATQPWLAERADESVVIVAASGSTRHQRESSP